jgi:3-oxoacyl-[acyl-carrier protein] reductase/pteridine reductase
MAIQRGEGGLAGRVILVTGAAKRIGRGIALHLAGKGASVAIHYRSSEAEARATAEECGGAPVFRADLARVAEIEKLFDAVVAHFGRIDGLVNNAARFEFADPLEITEAQWDAIHAINLKATFFCCQQAARRMLGTGGGRIVNISSLGGLKAWPEHAHYCASKAGVVRLTEALAQAWAPKITVNSVAPGVIPFGEPDERVRRLVAKTPAGRAGTAEEIADAVAYFLSASDFVTGQMLAIDGGLGLK